MTSETKTEAGEATGSHCSANGSRQVGAADAELGSITTVYEVRGMTCGHCEGAVAEELSALTGVTSVAAVAATGRVTVISHAPLDESDVREAVDEAGYELIGQA
ncbi:heavy-metal-associated domain-containing protein [Streptomyces sp. NPDC059176]|uniref:heavy-metal-associated domain-containing protein n=1 Tax=unclassified Streptomyces TaxID=2593676 RepID=UPI00368041B7